MMVADDFTAIAVRRRQLGCWHYPHDGIQHCPKCGWYKPYQRTTWYDFVTGKPVNGNPWLR